ncbi:MAG: hypothetical protein E7159_00945 [Firmicutes bacterium]|nr:hypothetical protein [Bacillota bacterium]
MRNATIDHHFNEEKYQICRARVIIFSIFLAIFLGIGIFLCHNVVKRTQFAPVKYCDTGSQDYRVYLKENEFYSDEFLPKGMAYPTTAIDYIEFNYNYIFNIDDIATMDFEYEILGDLVIENNSTKKTSLKETHTLVEAKSKSLKGSNEIVINEKFKVDYAEYNTFANKYRTFYAMDTNSYLKVYMKVKRNTIDGSKYTLKNDTIKINEVSIPLSERAIEMNIDSQNNKVCDEISFSETQTINYTNLGIAVLCIAISLYLTKKLIYTYKRMLRRRSIYDQYINKLLKEYDRLIVVTKTLIDFRKYNIIKVPEFDELLDVRDNLKVPINYYCYVKHYKGILYIKNEDDIYALFLSSEMLEKDK